MSKQLLISLACILLGATSCLAQNTLMIHQKSGGVVSYAFSDQPVVTYVNDTLHVETAQESIDYPLNSLEQITFAESSTAIGELRVEAQDAEVCIYRLDGILVKRALGKADTRVSTSALPAGTYIIKQGKVTTKLIKR